MLLQHHTPHKSILGRDNGGGSAWATPGSPSGMAMSALPRRRCPGLAVRLATTPRASVSSSPCEARKRAWRLAVASRRLPRRGWRPHKQKGIDVMASRPPTLAFTTPAPPSHPPLPAWLPADVIAASNSVTPPILPATYSTKMCGRLTH